MRMKIPGGPARGPKGPKIAAIDQNLDFFLFYGGSGIFLITGLFCDLDIFLACSRHDIFQGGSKRHAAYIYGALQPV